MANSAPSAASSSTAAPSTTAPMTASPPGPSNPHSAAEYKKLGRLFNQALDDAKVADGALRVLRRAGPVWAELYDKSIVELYQEQIDIADALKHIGITFGKPQLQVSSRLLSIGSTFALLHFLSPAADEAIPADWDKATAKQMAAVEKRMLEKRLRKIKVMVKVRGELQTTCLEVRRLELQIGQLDENEDEDEDEDEEEKGEGEEENSVLVTVEGFMVIV
ncbi:hypothetical protein P154DRAFT_538352 [Amniculicola lignicola CBS 123094]|uniref:Uncharacterized protein n=1 Tax=Amniculicola lignicola CBS 123094 TaxID=1392246 RepID=A0A6A5W4S8_9PLEO|nr:hypothetical protein P154DRAFT_538352 [Amniculicola lignicola CBS 123094]